MNKNAAPQTETPAEDVKTTLLRFLLKKTISDAVVDEVKGDRSSILEALVAQYDDTGAARLAVKHPGTGEVLANLTLTIPKEPKVQITDEDALREWSADNRPWWFDVEEIPGREEWTETIVHPAEPARTVETLNVNAWQDEEHEVGEDGTVVTAEGEVIPGVRVTMPAPDRFSVTYPKKGESQARVIDAWRAGEFPGLRPGAALPVIGEIESA